MGFPDAGTLRTSLNQRRRMVPPLSAKIFVGHQRASDCGAGLGTGERMLAQEGTFMSLHSAQDDGKFLLHHP